MHPRSMPITTNTMSSHPSPSDTHMHVIWSEIEARYRFSQKLSSTHSASSHGDLQHERPLTRQEKISLVKEQWFSFDDRDSSPIAHHNQQSNPSHPSNQSNPSHQSNQSNHSAEVAVEDLENARPEGSLTTADTVRVLELVRHPRSHGNRKYAIELKKRVDRGIHSLLDGIQDASERLGLAEIIYTAAFEKLEEMLELDSPEAADLIQKVWDGFSRFTKNLEDDKAILREKLHLVVDEKKGFEEEFTRLTVMVDNFQLERKNFSKYVANQSILKVELENLQKAFDLLVAEYESFSGGAIWTTLPLYGSAPIDVRPPQSLPQLVSDMREAGSVLGEHISKIAMLKNLTSHQGIQTSEITLKDAEPQTEIVAEEVIEDFLRTKIQELIQQWSTSTQVVEIEWNENIKDAITELKLPESFDFAVNWLQILPRERLPEFFPGHYMEILIAEIYNEYLQRFMKPEIPLEQRPSLADFVLRFHFFKYGKRGPDKLHDFLFTLIREVNSSIRCRWFARFCCFPNGTFTPLKHSVFQVYMEALQSLLAPSLAKKTVRPLNCSMMGVISVPYKIAREAIVKMFPLLLESNVLGPAQEKLKQHSSNSVDSEQPVDFDVCMELIVNSWLEERARGQELLQNIFTAADIDRNGAIDVNELWVVVKTFSLGIENEKIYDVYQYSITRVDGVNFDIFGSLLDEVVHDKTAHILNFPQVPHDQSFQILQGRFREFQPLLDKTLDHLEKSLGVDSPHYILVAKSAISFQMLLVSRENAEISWLSFAMLQTLVRGPPPEWERYGARSSSSGGQSVAPEIVRAATRSSMSWGTSFKASRGDSSRSSSRSFTASSAHSFIPPQAPPALLATFASAPPSAIGSRRLSSAGSDLSASLSHSSSRRRHTPSDS